MEIIKKNIKVKDLEANNGQIAGLPMNYRKINLKNMKALQKSMQECPELLQLRPPIVIEQEGKFVVLSGNHRLKAAIGIGMDEMPCLVVPNDTPARKLREIAAKDNKDYAETIEALLHEWPMDELREWDLVAEVEVPDIDIEIKEPKEKDKTDIECPKCGFKWRK